MVNDTITLNFEIEKGEPIGRYYFSARIKLTDESKDFLREKLGSTVQFDNLDDYLNLNPENFYIYDNKYSGYNGRSELYVRDDNGRYLTSNLPLNHNGFSIELSADGASIVDYGFYPLAVIYNPNYYNKAEEKAFDDHGELSPTVSSILDKLLSNKNNLATQDVLQNAFLQLQKEAAEEVERLAREKEEERQMEEELSKKNEELKELIEKDEIKVFKVIKGLNIDNGRSAVVLQRDREEVILDSSKYYIAEYKHHPEWEGDEYLHFVGPRDDMLVDYEGLFFVLNQSSYSGFESGFYSADRTDPHNYARYSKDRYLGGDQLSKELSNRLEEGNNQVSAKFTTDNKQMDKGVAIENEIKSRKKRAIEEDDDDAEKSSSSMNTQAKSKDEKITAMEPQENSVLQETRQKLSPNSDEDLNLNAKDSMGYTALHKAVFSKRFDEVKLLIDKGARVDVQDKHELTPLFYAVMNNDEKMIKLLVETGNADVNLGKYNNPPKKAAIREKNGEGMLKYLKKITMQEEESDQMLGDQPANEERKRDKRSSEEDKDKQEGVMIKSVIDGMKGDTEENDPKHPLKIKVGEAIGDGKYKAVLQAQDQDIDNFYQNLSSQYTAGKYNYNQMIALYNKVYVQDSKLDGKPITLSEAYVTNDHLFIKNQDFGTLDDFNEMFYKSDELV
ncbi:ankyrin repeat domain-containing protein [Wolbachia endosymbiont of Atemnus politus]|uniref:ankyrin repeat domain-containing protein n=1 Tax=Wolbachia endosymbiont of Atemnus politus TaxID=2682840 RepID=UPI002101F7F4|nr:ankyrin repeat domain-containing protein [Wolbachia endosymbiont of Atemnus politus]